MQQLVAILLCAATSLYAEEGYRPIPAEAMRLFGQSAEMETLLSNYYQKTLGGIASWGKVQSIRFHGVLESPQGMVEFVAFKKKPNYCKIVIYGANHMRVVMATDGQDAWQLGTDASPEAIDMPELEAINFLRDASIGGHLLYPNMPGKTIDLLATERVNGELCYRFQVRLPDGLVVEYFIDVTDFVERRQVVTNAVSGQQEITDHFEHREVGGLQIPFRSVMSSNGEQVHAVRLLDVDLNVGAASWMFARDSAAYMPKSGRDRISVSGSEPVELSFPGDDSGLESRFKMPEINEVQREELLRDIEIEL